VRLERAHTKRSGKAVRQRTARQTGGTGTEREIEAGNRRAGETGNRQSGATGAGKKAIKIMIMIKKRRSGTRGNMDGQKQQIKNRIISRPPRCCCGRRVTENGSRSRKVAVEPRERHGKTPELPEALWPARVSIRAQPIEDEVFIFIGCAPAKRSVPTSWDGEPNARAVQRESFVPKRCRSRVGGIASALPNARSMLGYSNAGYPGGSVRPGRRSPSCKLERIPLPSICARP
jgi:hypothetical protein